MNIFYIILTIIILIIILWLNYDQLDLFDNLTTPKIVSDDNNYFKKFSNSSVIKKLVDNNKIKKLDKKNKILIITYDNRKEEDYVHIHNRNILEYVKKYNYEYNFYTKCVNNVYWCKINMVLDALKTNKYDYVMWMDSDTVIKNFDINIGDILNNYSSDVFIGLDNNDNYDLTNSGVFIIKNSIIGKNFLNDCLNTVDKDCINKDGSLNGKWAASCYEQGIMNLMIVDKYSSYTTVLPNDIIFNYNVCSNKVFIMHLYASSSDDRMKCFTSKKID